MLLSVDVIELFDCLGRKIKHRNVHLRCDSCGTEFRRRRTLRDVKRDYHYCRPECRYASMKLGGKQNDVLRATSKARYGVDYPIQSEAVRKKAIDTWIENLGVDNPARSQIIRARIQTTCTERYGSASGFASPKTQETCLERYGTPTPPGIIHRHGKHESLKSGMVSYRSSYELQAYHLLDADMTVMSYATETLQLWYEIDGKKKRYFPDIIVKRFEKPDLIIEVKPARHCDRAVNVLKQQAAIDYCKINGLDYELWTEEKLFGER